MMKHRGWKAFSQTGQMSLLILALCPATFSNPLDFWTSNVWTLPENYIDPDDNHRKYRSKLNLQKITKRHGHDPEAVVLQNIAWNTIFQLSLVRRTIDQELYTPTLIESSSTGFRFQHSEPLPLASSENWDINSYLSWLF